MEWGWVSGGALAQMVARERGGGGLGCECYEWMWVGVAHALVFVGKAWMRWRRWLCVVWEVGWAQRVWGWGLRVVLALTCVARGGGRGWWWCRAEGKQRVRLWWRLRQWRQRGRRGGRGGV